LGKSKYRGLIRFHRVSPGKLIAVNGVGLESYVSSVIDGEMPADFPDAARRSQAIVARTYALYQQRRSRKHPHFDLYATTRSQKYLGVEYRDRRGRLLAGESAQSRRLADETRGLVATYRGELFCTYYSAVCGGHTTQGKAVFADAAPPLKRVDCDWCRDARFFRWTASLSRSQLTKAVKRHLGTSKQPFGSITELSVAPGRSTQAGELAGTINQFQAVDEHRAYRLSAAQLRRWLPTGTLYSPRFTVSAKDDAFLFSGQGHGHGVGLCQWGARGMAQAGKTTMEILEHYYPGSEVSIVETLFQNPQAAGLAPVEGSTNPDGPPSEGLAGVP
jgi:stage II sporulation protein D